MKITIKSIISLFLVAVVVYTCCPISVFASEAVSDETYATTNTATIIAMLLVALGIYSEGSSALQQATDSVIRDFEVIQGGGQPSKPPHGTAWTAEQMIEYSAMCVAARDVVQNMMARNAPKDQTNVSPEGRRFFEDNVLHLRSTELATFSEYAKKHFACDPETIADILYNQLNAPIVYFPANIYQSPYTAVYITEVIGGACSSVSPVYCYKMVDDLSAGYTWNSKTSPGGEHIIFPGGGYYTITRNDISGKVYFEAKIYIESGEYVSQIFNPGGSYYVFDVKYSYKLYSPLVINLPKVSGGSVLILRIPIMQFNNNNQTVLYGTTGTWTKVGTTQTLSDSDMYNLIYGDYDPSIPIDSPALSVNPDTGVLTNNYYNTTYNPAIDYSAISEAVQTGVENATINIPEQDPVTQTIKNLYYEGDQITKVYPETEVVQAQQTMNEAVLEDLPQADPAPADKLDTPAESIDKMKISEQITYKFPFSVPWDVKRCFELLQETSIEPIFILPFHIESVGIDEEITIDLTSDTWDTAFRVMRFFVFLLFMIALIVGTRNLIKG